MFKKKTVLTGIKPTGTPHLGNLVGAIKPVIDMSQDADLSFVFIADLHALNAVSDRGSILRDTYRIAATFLAFGLNPQKTVFFRQSDIPEVYQLSTLLNNVTPKGMMNRAHAYKAAVERNVIAKDDPDSGVNMGLFNYPILMAADILLYGANAVPVGQDQKQHVEFTRDIAGNFNRIYGPILTMPEPVIQKTANSIPGLDGRKMSKSYENTIPIFAPPSDLKKLIMRIITDSKTPNEPKDPDTSTVFQLYQNFASLEEIAFMRESFLLGGMGYGEAKTLLFDAINQRLEEPRERYKEFINHYPRVENILLEGADRARCVASETMSHVQRAMLGRVFDESPTFNHAITSTFMRGASPL